MTTCGIDRMAIKDRLCCAWWALTGKLDAKITCYIRIYSLVMSIREGLYKLKHLKANEKADFAVMHNLGLLCGYITTGSWRERVTAPDVVLMGEAGRQEAYEELMSSIEYMHGHYWKARIIVRDLADFIATLSMYPCDSPKTISLP